MVEKIDHIGIAVEDLDQALANYKRIFGLEPLKVETLEYISTKMAYIKVGEVIIELLQPTERGAGRIGPFLLENGGDGFHHVALRVDDIDRELSRLKKEKVLLRDAVPREGGDDSRIAFIEPFCTHNVLTELIERKREIE